jgi:hypothetical protein
LAEQNNCLLKKHLHKFLNRANLPWVKLVWEAYYSTALPPNNSRDVSFWWRYCLKCLPGFKALAQCSVASGASILLLHDVWAQQPLSLALPHLYSFSKNTEVSIASVLQLDFLHSHFHLPLSVEAFAQLHELHDMLQGL